MRLTGFINNLLFHSGFILLLLLCFSACNEDKNVQIISRPEGILPDSTMVVIMRDASLLEARVSLLKLNIDTAKAVFDSAFKQILISHHTDSIQFDSTLKYYGKSIELIDELYRNVADSVNAMRPERMMKKSK